MSAAITSENAAVAFPVAAQVFSALVVAQTRDPQSRLGSYKSGKLAEKAITAALEFEKKWSEAVAGKAAWMAPSA